MPRCQLIRLLIPWFIHSRSRRLLVFSPAPCLGRSRDRRTRPPTQPPWSALNLKSHVCVSVCVRVQACVHVGAQGDPSGHVIFPVSAFI